MPAWSSRNNCYENAKLKRLITSQNSVHDLCDFNITRYSYVIFFIFCDLIDFVKMSSCDLVIFRDFSVIFQ